MFSVSISILCAGWLIYCGLELIAKVLQEKK